MKILQLTAENIKKLSAIEITPTDNLVTITGDNGAGKSSVLDSIVMALCGKSSIPAQPIKRGADKGKIVLDMGEFTITRSFTPTNSYLKIEPKDGSVIKSPQKFLDDLVGNVSFDPLEFLNHDPKKQRDILLQLIGVNVDELDRREKELRESRTLAGRIRDKAESAYKALPSYPNEPRTEELKADEMLAELQQAVTRNEQWDKDWAANEEIKKTALARVSRISQAEVEIANLEAEIAELRDLNNSDKVIFLAKKQELETMPKQDISELSQKVAGISETNAQIRANVAKLVAKNEFEAQDAIYANLTKDIETLARERKDLLSASTMPVPNLSFDDSGLTYNSIPLAQASDGEKLMVSMGISMALNPTIRVLRIKDGSLLGPGNREILATMIKEKDYQLWFESVDTSGKVGVYIEEGEIRAIDGKEQTKKAKTPAASTSKSKDQLKQEAEADMEARGFKVLTTGDPGDSADGW